MKTSTWVMIASVVVIVFFVGMALGLWALPVASSTATETAAAILPFV